MSDHGSVGTYGREVRAVKLALVSMVSTVVIVLAAGRADAYPQFQLSRDSTCTACHISPAGGGLLTENGLNTADTMSQFGTAPEFMYGKLVPPDWLVVGGDVRVMGGWIHAPQDYLLGIPMQGDVYAHASKGNFAAQLTVGIRPAQVGNEALTRVWAREHYLTWQSNPGEREGQWIRVGHLMPVFGLRFVEHPLYTRRFGGTPLYSETYGAVFSAVTEKFEVHVSGFLKDPVIDGVAPNNGGAAYGEFHVAGNTLVGAGGMATQSSWEHRYRATVTAKQYLPTPGLLLQTELQYAYVKIDGLKDYGVDQLMGTLMASYSIGESVMIDLALGHYDENLRIHAVDRDCVDLNVHWFVTSHVEALLVTRAEMIGKGQGGDSSGWAMAQLHYRL